jgi:hypothetical protein
VTPPGTPLRTIRVDADLWGKVKEQAKAEGITVSELTRSLYRGWLNKNQDKEAK